MKRFLLFHFLLVAPLFIFCQKQKGVALKVYVKDAETGENVPDTKVMLEGYDIPPIEGRYNKKWAYYYFKEIPAGYNTVVAYHDRYNEKGFQSVHELPKELTLYVQDYRYVSYHFEKPLLRHIDKYYLLKNQYLDTLYETLREKGSIKHKNFKYLYTEDPYHIAIITKQNDKDFFSNDSINLLLNNLSLERTIYLTSHKNISKLYCYGFTDDGFNKGEYLERNGKSTCWFYPGAKVLYNVFFFHKKDKTKFSRYNCKEMLELSKLNLKVAALTNRIIEYYADAPFNPKSFDQFYNYRIRGSLYQAGIDNYQFGRLLNPERVFFKNSEEENKMFFGGNKVRIFEDVTSDYSIRSLFFIVGKNNPATGLGALDSYSSDNSSFYFFNSLYDISLESVK